MFTFFTVNYNTSDLINSLILSIFKFADFDFKIVIFDNSDKEKLNIKIDSNKISVIDNSQQQLINFNDIINRYVKNSRYGDENNFASLKHCYTIDYAIKKSTELTDDIILCDSDIIFKKKIDFIDTTYDVIGQIKQTWSMARERLLPMLCYFKKSQVLNHNINFFDSNRFLNCSNHIPR